MANSAAEQIQVTQYKISGFNVVVTMPDGQEKVLKDGLADIMLGNIVLLDKNGNPITKEAILDHVSVKQNALDSAFLGDFIKNKSDKQEDEAGQAKDQERSANEEMLQSIIKKLDTQLNEYKKNTSDASSQIDKLASENQAKLQTIAHYLQQLDQVKAEAAVLRQEATEKTVELQSIKEQLPYQKLAETFKSRQQSESSDEGTGAQSYATTQPVPVSKVSPSSSASPPDTEKDDRPTLQDNEVAVDKEKLKELEETLKTTTDEKDKIESELTGTKDALESQLQGVKDQLDKTESELDKVLEDKNETDKVNNSIKETLNALGSANFISDDFIISASLDPASDHGNSIESSKTDNITNVLTPAFIGTASTGTTVTLLISSDGGASHAQANIAVDDEGKWSYTVPADALTAGSYKFSATSNKQMDVTIDGKTQTVTQSSKPITGVFVIDTTPPVAEVTAITDSRHNDDGSWLSGTLTPAFSGATKPNSDVTLVITATGATADAFTEYRETFTSSPTGLWSIVIPENTISTSGDYHYSITVTDNAGNSGSSEANLMIDNKALISTLLLAEASDSGTKGDWQTNVTTPTFEGITTKNGIAVADVKVKITIDGENYETTSNADGKWSVDVTKAVATIGNQTVSLLATDSLGKTFSTSHVINIDNRLPNIDASLTKDSDTGENHSDGITNSKAPVLHGITSANSDVTVTVYYNPTGKGYSTINDTSYKHTETISTTTGDWTYSVPMSDILAEIKAKYPETASTKYQYGVAGHGADGVYQYSVSVRDSLGNENTTDVAHLNSWIIDTVAPTIAVSVNGDQLATNLPAGVADPNYAVKVNTPTITIETEANSKVTITYPGADGTPGHAALTGTTDENGFLTKKLTAALATWIQGVPTSGSQLHITVEDKAGNKSTRDFHFKYIPSTDSKIPISAHLDQADDSGVSNIDGITNITRPHIVGTTVPGAAVTLSVSSNGIAPFEISTTADTHGNWRLQITSDLPDGVTVFTATASSGGITSSTSGSVQIDTTPPKLTDLQLGGPKIGYVDEGWQNGKRVDWSRTSWEGNKIIFSTGEKLRQQGAATFTGSVSEKATIVSHNYMDKDTNPRYNNTAVTFTGRNDKGQPEIKLAMGFNYLQSDLTEKGKNTINRGDRPEGWAWDDLKNGSSIYGLGWDGFNGRWSLNKNRIDVTDLAGNKTTYTVAVEYNSVAPRVSGIHIVGTAGDDGPYNADTSVNKGLGQTLYINSLSGFAIGGRAEGAVAVYLVDVSNKSDAWLQNPGNRYSAAKDPHAKKYIGTLNSDGSWSVPYIANVRPGDHATIKVIPVLTNPTGRPQDQMSYLKVNILQQHYSSSVDLSADTDTGTVGDKITSNKQPTLEGVIENYNATVSATISLDGATAAPLTINPDGSWSYNIPYALADAIHRYTVTIKDKYGNGQDHSDRFDVTGSFTIAAGVYGSLDPSAANDSGVTGDGITNVKSPTLIGKVDAGTTAKVIYTDLAGAKHTITNITTTADGNWTAKITDVLADGDYTFSVVAIRAGDGQEVARKDGLTFTIDTTPPNVTTEVDSNFISPLAADKTDDLFNHDPVLKGVVSTTDSSGAHGEGNRPVTITVPVGDKTYVYQGSTNSLGEYSIALNINSLVDKTLPALPDGSYTYSVRGEDVAGNAPKAPVTGTFSLDTTPPETLQFGVKAASLHDTDGMTLYTRGFYNSTLHGKTDPGDRIVIEFTGVGINEPGSKINPTTAFKGYVVPADKITMRDDGSWSAVLSGLGNITVDRYNYPPPNFLPALSGSIPNPDGAYYTAKIMAVDAAGNAKTSSFHYELATSPPTTTTQILTSVGGKLPYHNLTYEQQPIFIGKTRSGATVTLNLSSSDKLLLKPGASDLDPTKKQSFTVKAGDDGRWRIPIDEEHKLTDGFYYYSVTVTDENNLTQTIGDKAMGGADDKLNYMFKVDTTPTGVEAHLDQTNDSGISGDFITNINHQKVNGTAGKNTAFVRVYTSQQPFSEENPGTQLDANMIKDAVSLAPLNVQKDANNWYVDFTDLADGTYYIRVESGNYTGRVDNTELQFTIDTKAPELNNAGLSLESDTGIVGDRITSQTSPVLAGTSKPGTKLKVHVQDGSNWQIIDSTADKDGQWHATMPTLAAGTHKYWIEATDIAGNTNQRGSQDTPLADDYFIIQNVYTGVDTEISSTLDANSDTGLRDYITENGTPTITGNAPVVANSVDGKSSRVFLDIVVNGVTHTYTGFNNGRGNYSIKITDKLPDGYYNYKVYTTDAAGNKSTIYNSPANLTVRDSTTGEESSYAFKVQSSTPYTDLGLTDKSYGGISGTPVFNTTTSTSVGLQGQIKLGRGDTASDFTVKVAIADLSNDGNPITLASDATISADGKWSSSQLSITSLGIHNYTVTINDRRTGSNTSYSNVFTVRSDKSSTVTDNDTLAEQHGTEPIFSGTAPIDTSSILLTVFSSDNKKVGEKTILTNTATGKWSYQWTTADGQLFDGQYTYTLKTVNNVGVISSSFASGNLEVYTTPPALNYVEQDTHVVQNSAVVMQPAVLFSGHVELAKGKFSATLPDDTLVVKFKDFEIKATVDSKTGKWEISNADYQKQLAAHSDAKPEDNTAYTVTLKDRFGNISTDTGDLAPNNEHHGNVNRPLFMGESDPGATITVIVENTTTNIQSTVQTKVDDKGHWEVTWNKDLDIGTYNYSLNIVTTDGNNYNTGNLGSVNINPVSATPAAHSLSAAAHDASDLLSSTGTAPDSTVSPDLTHTVDGVTRAAVEHTPVTMEHHDLDKVA